jgi:hypothetical protein
MHKLRLTVPAVLVALAMMLGACSGSAAPEDGSPAASSAPGTNVVPGVAITKVDDACKALTVSEAAAGLGLPLRYLSEGTRPPQGHRCTYTDEPDGTGATAVFLLYLNVDGPDFKLYKSFQSPGVGQAIEGLGAEAFNLPPAHLIIRQGRYTVEARPAGEADVDVTRLTALMRLYMARLPQ